MPIGCYSSCGIARHKWEQPAVAVPRVQNSAGIFRAAHNGGTYQRYRGTTTVRRSPVFYSPPERCRPATPLDSTPRSKGLLHLYKGRIMSVRTTGIYCVSWLEDFLRSHDWDLTCFERLVRGDACYDRGAPLFS